MEPGVRLSPAGLDRPSRVSAYHVAVEAVEYALSRGHADGHANFLIVSSMREILPLDATEEDFDRKYAEVRAVEWDQEGGILSIPFKTAIDTVERGEEFLYASCRALSLYVALITSGCSKGEVHMMAINCGPLGLPLDLKPSSDRCDRKDRSWQRIVRASADQPKK